MLDEITSEEFGMWVEFCQEIEPFGDDWRRAALMPTLYWNAHRAKGARPIDVDDLIPLHRPPPDPAELSQQIIDAFKAIAASAKKARAEEKTDG